MSLLKQWSECMKIKNWIHTVDTEKSIIFFTASNEVASLRFTFLIKETDNRVILLLSYERHCPDKYRQIMADFVNRVNYAIPIGFFAIDISDGEVRYRHGIDVEGIEINEVFVDNFIRSCITFCRKYYNPIQAIMNGYSIEAAMETKEEV